MRWSECPCLSRIVLTHTPRQPRSSLIFDVRPRKPFMNLSLMSRRIRWRRASIIGICATVTSIGAIAWFIHSNHIRTFLSLDDALWVSDWNVTSIYGPGTKEQNDIVQQLRVSGREFGQFKTPILYRMGGDSSMKSSEGILMIPFDPNRPQDALALKAESTTR